MGFHGRPSAIHRGELPCPQSFAPTPVRAPDPLDEVAARIGGDERAGAGLGLASPAQADQGRDRQRLALLRIEAPGEQAPALLRERQRLLRIGRLEGAQAGEVVHLHLELARAARGGQRRGHGAPHRDRRNARLRGVRAATPRDRSARPRRRRERTRWRSRRLQRLRLQERGRRRDLDGRVELGEARRRGRRGGLVGFGGALLPSHRGDDSHRHQAQEQALRHGGRERLAAAVAPVVVDEAKGAACAAPDWMAASRAASPRAPSNAMAGTFVARARSARTSRATAIVEQACRREGLHIMAPRSAGRAGSPARRS